MRRLLGDSGTGHGDVPKTELLRLKKNGQFPDEIVKIEDTQIHSVSSQTY